MMMAFLQHTWYMTWRHMKPMLRRPIMIVMSMIQPIVWLLLFSGLFRKVVDIPGFETDSYISFLLPGIIVMNALFVGVFTGMGTVIDLNNGVIDRFLISPVERVTFILGKLIQQAVLFVVQSLILIVLSVMIGAKFSGPIYGVFIVIAGAVLLGVAVGALSIGFALITRRIESMVSMMQFITLPLMFLSSALMPQDLAPAWMKVVGYFNPVNWAVLTGRNAFRTNADWEVVLLNGSFVLVFAIVCVLLSTRAFRAYQRSV
ncbi:transport permease protein [Bacillus sp. J14TS2]|uniref:ABC transporter permease n=1 Tax=Bacillus sp. J14TS2 TaxID=2807188 RepID=UPI001B2F22E7|nr:ABC transporter permease [Bacillus sp. J14TS2]GIN73912.1 transport permease protein [Bacillus sp. J14TS2]